jgi:hypothetical protein
MREIRTYGSVGALGGNPQGDPAIRLAAAAKTPRERRAPARPRFRGRRGRSRPTGGAPTRRFRPAAGGPGTSGRPGGPRRTRRWSPRRSSGASAGARIERPRRARRVAAAVYDALRAAARQAKSARRGRGPAGPTCGHWHRASRRWTWRTAIQSTFAAAGSDRPTPHLPWVPILLRAQLGLARTTGPERAGAPISPKPVPQAGQGGGNHKSR